MTILMRITNGEIIAKDFKDDEDGYINGLIDLDRIMLDDLGDTVPTYMHALFGLDIEVVQPSHVYLSEDGVLFAPSFVIAQEDKVEITDKHVRAKKFTKQNTIT